MADKNDNNSIISELEYRMLIEELGELSKEYYNNTSKVSDQEYDEKYRQLVEFEKANPNNIASNSPTQKIGATPNVNSPFQKVKLELQMYSLDNAYSDEDLIRFINRVDKSGYKDYSFTVEEKIDGIALSLQYEHGKLQSIITRGDGKVGEDITQQQAVIENLPATINYDKKLILRGEVYMTKENFEKLNEMQSKLGLQTFSNPRNATAGSLRLLDRNELMKRKFNLFIYNCELQPTQTHYDNLMFAQNLGFKTPKMLKRCHNLDEIKSQLDSILEEREDLSYNTDGAVIKVNELHIQNELGYSIKSPKWAVAYKYPSQNAKTKLLNVEFQIGRTGTITPIAVLEPVEISGSIVQRATLHNQDELKRLNIKYNDYVFIEKGGEIIPKITAVDTSTENSSPNVTYPEVCPKCGTQLQQVEGYVKIICPNYDCKGRTARRIEHFASKNAMNIAGIDEKTAEFLVNEELVSYFADIYKIEKETLNKYQGWAAKSITQLLKEIQKSSERPFDRLLFAIGVDGIGSKTAESFANTFKNIDALLNASIEELSNIDRIGESNAKSIYESLHSKEIVAEIEMLKLMGFSFEVDESVSENGSNILTGKTLMITGTLSKPRTEIERLIKMHGGKVGSSVSKNTNYLIAGENAGSKLDKARSLNVQVLTETEFLALVNHTE